MSNCIPGLNSERQDPFSGVTHLGNGYRAYTPSLLRFYCPDGWSPVRAGGINSYAYCAGDPVNRADPSGHHSLEGWLGIGAGVVLGLLMTPVSAGSSLALALSVVTVTAAVASAGLAISQQFVEASDPHAASVLGWAGLGTGIVSGICSAALCRIIPGAKSLESLLKGVSGRPFGGMMMTGDADGRPAGSVGARAISEDGRIISRKSNVTVYDYGDTFKKVFTYQDKKIVNEYRIHKLYHGETSAEMPNATTILTKKINGVPVQNGAWKFTPVDRDNLLGAVRKAHGLKIFHGDLHLNNILFDESVRKFNLIDFGQSVYPASDGLLNLEFDDFLEFMQNKWARFGVNI